MQEEKTIVIDIRLTKGAVLALVGVFLIATLLVCAATTGKSAAAAQDRAVTGSSGMRQFYLTETGSYYGSIASSACAPGYHMASLWEIAEPSNLKYNTALGYSQSDSGQGPPADDQYVFGWVRTGYTSNESTTPGRANCASWTSHSFFRYGSTAALPAQWTANLEDLGVWQLSYAECDDWNRVWCIED